MVMKVFTKNGLAELFDALQRRGFTLVGPTVRDEAIVYDELKTPDDLPVGWRDEQDGGRYRLHRRDDYARFGYAVGPQSWKRFLYPPRVRLWRAQRNSDGFTVDAEQEFRPLALIGVRACELEAIKIQDRVLLGGEYADPVYQGWREQAFIVAVNCTEAGGTCFCASMKTGPRAGNGYDLALTEVIDGDAHYFTVDVGSDRAREVMRDVKHRDADEAEEGCASAAVDRARSQMGRELDASDLKELLYENRNHPRWDEVADRCLTCGNCTQVCPTCFCHTVEDVTDLTGAHAERWRRWDSCFNLDFSYIHGGSIRTSTRARYRQWITHKLADWSEQFGTTGCVGCGRCITWCPVGIDITEEVREIRQRRGATV